MEVIAIHIEDEKQWRDVIREDLLEIDEFDTSNIKSFSSIEDLKKSLKSISGKVILIMDLRLGGEKHTNYGGYHWLLEELPDLLSNNASTSVYIVTGRLGGNEIARETLLRQGTISEDHIFDKGFWEVERDRFIASIRNDVARIDDVALRNISKNLSGGRIDPYLIHTLNLIKGGKNDDMTEDDKPSLLPMLVRVQSQKWNYSDLPDIKILGKIGNVYACLGSSRTIAALERDPNVISVEASRAASRPDCDVSIPYVNGTTVHNDLEEKGDKALIGFIDTGIDILHEAFLDATKTRSQES